MSLRKGARLMGLLRFILFTLVLRRFKWLGLALAGVGLARRFRENRGQKTSV